jgi:3-oxoacyl-[acyl-carrier-protein] synthase-1
MIPDISEKIAVSGILKKERARMSTAGLYAVLAAKDAAQDAGLTPDDLARPSSACIVGTTCSSLQPVYASASLTLEGRGVRQTPYSILHAMANNCASNVAAVLRVAGPSYSLASACATSAHAIGHAFEMIRHRTIDLAIAGGADEVDELMMSAFCALRVALSTRFNDIPARASRPYDRARDGFVMSGGAGVVIVESLRRAQERGARVLCEIAGYAANTDLSDFVQPDPKGWYIESCVRQALSRASIASESIDYVNTHGTGTVAGDAAEITGLKLVFGGGVPPFSSTKSMGGHSLGAAGALELIHCIAMMDGGFIAPSINIEELDPCFEGLPVVRETVAQTPRTILSNSFGFGGGNACLVLRHPSFIE